MASVITRFVAKQLFGQKGAIANRKAVDFSAAKMAERLSEFGIDPRQIKTEKELIQLLNLVKQAEDQAFAQKFSGILAPKKSAEVVDLQGKKIPNPEKNIMGGQAFETEEEIAERIAKQNKESIERLKEKRLKEKLDDADDLDPEEKADGGRIGYFLGSPGNIKKGQSLLRALLNYFGKETGKAKPSDFLRLTNPKSFNKLFEEAQGKMSKEGIMGTDMVKDYQTQMLGERIKSIKDMLESGKNIKRSQDRITSYKNEVKQKFMDDLGLSEEEAEVAATRLSTLAENIVSKEGSRKLPNITEEGILQLENIIKNMETGGKKARDLNAYGGRIGFKMGRRAFLKALGAGIGGAAALKTGILKILGKEGTKQAADVAVTSSDKVPPYFLKLAEQIKLLGRESKGTQERINVYSMKGKDGKSELILSEDVGTGEMQIKKIGKENDEMVTEVQTMEYTPGRAQADETTKGTPADQYEEYTEYNSRIQKDEFNDPIVEDGINAEDISKEIKDKFDVEQEILEEVARDKKASGGIAMMLGQ